MPLKASTPQILEAAERQLGVAHRRDRLSPRGSASVLALLCPFGRREQGAAGLPQPRKRHPNLRSSACQSWSESRPVLAAVMIEAINNGRRSSISTMLPSKRPQCPAILGRTASSNSDMRLRSSIFCSAIGPCQAKDPRQRQRQQSQKEQSQTVQPRRPENLLGRQTVLISTDDHHEPTFAVVDCDHLFVCALGESSGENKRFSIGWHGLAPDPTIFSRAPKAAVCYDTQRAKQKTWPVWEAGALSPSNAPPRRPCRLRLKVGWLGGLGLGSDNGPSGCRPKGRMPISATRLGSGSYRNGKP